MNNLEKFLNILSILDKMNVEANKKTLFPNLSSFYLTLTRSEQLEFESIPKNKKEPSWKDFAENREKFAKEGYIEGKFEDRNSASLKKYKEFKKANSLLYNFEDCLREELATLAELYFKDKEKFFRSEEEEEE